MQISSLSLSFPAVAGREVVARFDGGDLTSDAGLALVAAADRRCGVTAALAAALPDRRDPAKVRHAQHDLIRERVYAIAQGYEDANDLDRLRHDPALKLACDRLPRTGDALASQPTVSRLENGATPRALLAGGIALARVVVAQLPADTTAVVLDADATDDPCHGQQQFEAFNGFYDAHCYVPLLLYVTGGDGRQRLLGAVLRPGTATGTQGLGTMLRWAVRLLRERFPAVRILLRGDSGFGNATVLRWCHTLGVGYRLCVAQNPVLQERSVATQIDAALVATHPRAGEDGQEFGEFRYQAGTWAYEERVIVKAEVTQGKLNPRFVVTSEAETPEAEYRAYCARGDRENRIKEFKRDLASGRTSCHRFWANQFRVLLHLAASVLMTALQTAAQGTAWADAQVGTLRTRLLKVGARLVESCRKVWIHLPTACPVQPTWGWLHARLC
jgi:hypothetical protein